MRTIQAFLLAALLFAWGANAQGQSEALLKQLYQQPLELSVIGFDDQNKSTHILQPVTYSGETPRGHTDFPVLNEVGHFEIIDKVKFNDFNHASLLLMSDFNYNEHYDPGSGSYEMGFYQTGSAGSNTSLTVSRPLSQVNLSNLYSPIWNYLMVQGSNP